MKRRRDLTSETSPMDEESPVPDMPTGSGADETQAAAQPATAGTFGDQNERRGWLVAGVVMVGAAVLGIALFLVFVSGERTTSSPTPTLAVVYTTSTLKPTATRTPTATSTPTTTYTPSPSPTVTRTPTPTPDVILLGVKALGELNTVEYSLKTVVEKEARQPGLVTFGNIEIWRPRLHLLLVAGGRVKAGVDFREMVRYEIVDGKVTVYLSAPRITDYSIDARSLKLYYIHMGFGLDEEFILDRYNETVVEAQESLRSAALESDILDAAKTNAIALVQSLILGLGFSEVEVTFLPPSGDETRPLEEPLEFVLTPAPFVTATPEG